MELNLNWYKFSTWLCLREAAGQHHEEASTFRLPPEDENSFQEALLQVLEARSGPRASDALRSVGGFRRAAKYQ